MGYRILDVTDQAGFERIPPCADAGFDHRSCDYWEDDQRGSKAARLSWLTGGAPAAPSKPGLADNPFAPTSGPGYNPFAKGGGGGGLGAGGGTSARPANPFALDDDDDVDNPFAPRREARPGVAPDAPRKLQLLGRGLAVFGSYAKVLEADGEAVAYCQFGPLSAYPRATRVRDLYPQLPSSPLPAVITCIATTAAARRQGFARRLILSVVDDLTGRGFSAVEAYPEPGARPEATSAATPAFWVGCGFDVAVDDPRFPVVRREL
ncbi:MAG TPA: GNAT family N-acetyltransferase [Candidatus Limnocylindrales bacterium]